MTTNIRETVYETEAYYVRLASQAIGRGEDDWAAVYLVLADQAARRQREKERDE